jgi:AmmeMemoRadiSam system protein A
MRFTMLDARLGDRLIDLAFESIERALDRGCEVAPPRSTETPLAAIAASFVTLRIESRLRGCCGSLDARRALAADVWRNAYAAAFCDPRFPRLEPDELGASELSISVLSPLVPIAASSEAELCAALRPGVDGLVIECRAARATFLPIVWREIPEPARFLAQLCRKAGLEGSDWPADLRASRYTTRAFGPRSTSLSLRAAQR